MRYKVEIDRLREKMKDGKLVVAARLLAGTSTRGLLNTHFGAWRDDIAQATRDAQANSIDFGCYVAILS